VTQGLPTSIDRALLASLSQTTSQHLLEVQHTLPFTVEQSATRYMIEGRLLTAWEYIKVA
jgi:hypothetical protein